MRGRLVGMRTIKRRFACLNLVARWLVPFYFAVDVLRGQGETYSLFQDKVDEAEARLEVATDANNTGRRRYYIVL